MADETPKDETPKMVRVKVRVPSREPLGFPGYYSVGMFFPNGDSEAVIPEERLADLKAETTLAVVEVTPVNETSLEDNAPKAATPIPHPSAGEAPKKPSPAKPWRK